MKEFIGNKIKYLRTSHKLNQKELSAKIKVTQASLSLFENGNKLPSIDVLVRISKYFNVSLDWLCGLDNKPRFYTMADIIHAFLEFEKLSAEPFEIKIDSNEAPLSLPPQSYTDCTCSVSFTGRIYEPDIYAQDAIGHMCKFIAEWHELQTQLKLLPNGDLKENYYKMWLDKQIETYLSIPVHSQKDMQNFREYGDMLLDMFSEKKED